MTRILELEKLVGVVQQGNVVEIMLSTWEDDTTGSDYTAGRRGEKGWRV